MSRRSRAGGCFARLLAGSVVVLLLCAAGLAFLFFAPYQGFSKEVFVDFPLGTSTRAMADELANNGVIRSPWQFLLARAVRPSARLQAGEYRFSAADSVWNIFDRIARGDVYYVELSVPEGNNMFDIARAVEQLGIIKAGDFLRAARSPKLIHDLSPRAPTLEGYLFPSTYRLTRHTTAEQLCRLMTDAFRKHWAQVVPAGREVNVNATVTLASLIEKETGKAEERPRVAAVYVNRLRAGMPLDCDPTTIYAALLEDRYRGTIYRSDLQSGNEYNTYRHPGLPPGPIANPGVASLKAALSPQDSADLYFVAKPDGSGYHNFSSSLAEHERAVQAYRHRRTE